MSLKDKYASVVAAAQNGGVTGLQVREQDNVLYIDGTAPSSAVKDQVWAEYNKVDPDFRGGDMVLNLTVAPGETYEVQKGDNLSKIGKQFGKTWQEIYQANKDVIGDNPDLIKPGQKLQIP